MTFGMLLRTIFEIALIVFTLWAVYHEDRFAALERRLFARFRRRKFRVINGNCYKSSYPIHNR